MSAILYPCLQHSATAALNTSCKAVVTITRRIMINLACESPAFGTAGGLCTPNARLRGFLEITFEQRQSSFRRLPTFPELNFQL